MTRTRAVGLALAASFSVYAIPLWGVHTSWFVGELILQKPPVMPRQWRTLNLAVAFAVQVLVLGWFYWLFRKPGWRRLLPAVAVFPFVIAAVERGYLVAIPARFLEEPDTAPERESWPAVCTATGYFQTNLHTSSELWVRDSTPESRFAVLTMPGCRVEQVATPVGAEITGVQPNKIGLIRRFDKQNGDQSWSLTDGSEIQPPTGDPKNTWPILSQDGVSIAWLKQSLVVVRSLGPDRKVVTIDLSPIGRADWVLKSIDTKSREIVLWNTDRLVTVDFAGAPKQVMVEPAGIRAQAQTFIGIGTWWLGWDAYRDNERYSLAWSLPFGAGSHTAPLGRSIHSATFDPSGKWIAVSVGTSLNIGSARDAVYILSGADGHEVFRKYLPRYTRSSVAFLAGGYFAYSDLTGVRVLRAPE